MKQKLLLISAWVLLSVTAFSQSLRNNASPIKGSVFGIHFNVADFNGPSGVKNPITGNVYTSIKGMTKGLSISYWKGLTSKIDFSTKFNASFRDYPGIYYGEVGTQSVGLELEPTINVRPFNDNALFAPFLTAGIGGGFYGNSHFGAYVPAGLGIQVNLQSVTYLFLQAQYKFALTKATLGDNLFYSIGFAENLGRERKPKMVNIPMPEAPMIPVAVAPVVVAPKDTDGDGIPDIDDKCPTVAGLAKYQGCPIPDTDKDGINDEQDKCPTVPGVARYQGCPIPDTDGDGVNDEEDKCPTVAGPASNNGCPVISQAVVDKVNYAAKNIFFATGSAKLLPASFKPLNDVAKILSDDKSLKLAIDGYTDNVGDAGKNLSLSEARSAAVKTYLASKGVNDSNMTSAGHGQDNPAADNATAAGRAKNRRVELKVSNN